MANKCATEGCSVWVDPRYSLCLSCRGHIPSTCKVDSCENILGYTNKSGFCNLHKYFGRINPDLINVDRKICSADDCDKLLQRNNVAGRCTEHVDSQLWPSHENQWIRALLNMYQMTEDDYNNLILYQHGLCEFCHESLPNYSGCAIDHDHACCPGRKTCGKCIRAVLHRDCNRELGYYERILASGVLEKSIDYLERKKLNGMVEYSSSLTHSLE